MRVPSLNYCSSLVQVSCLVLLLCPVWLQHSNHKVLLKTFQVMLLFCSKFLSDPMPLRVQIKVLQHPRRPCMIWSQFPLWLPFLSLSARLLSGHTGILEVPATDQASLRAFAPASINAWPRALCKSLGCFHGI